MNNKIRSFIREYWLEQGFISSVTTSLPRDCLQAERSLLLYCKLGGMLALISLSMAVDYNLQGTVIMGHAPHFASKVFGKVVGVLFFVLAVGALALGAFNYYENIYHYFGQRRYTGPKLPTHYFVGTTALLLLAVNLTLLVDSRYWD